MRRLRGSLAAQAFATLVLLLACCCVGFPSAAGAQERAPALHPASSWNDQGIDLAKLFDAVVETVEQKFVDAALLRQIDWQARARAARPSVLSAISIDDAIRQINALLSELNTSHTRLYTPDEYDYYAVLDVVGASGKEAADLMSRRFWGAGPYYPGIGAFTREIDGRHFVDGLLEGSPAERAGLKYGDEILSVDGMPYSPVAVFRGRIGTMADLAIRRRPEADPQHLAVSVVPIRPTTAFSAATGASARVIERNGRRVGYVHVWASSESNSFRNAVAELQQGNPLKDPRSVPRPLDFLVVDMRGRVGGNFAVAGQFLDILDTTPKPYWGESRFIGRSGGPRSVNASPQYPPFRGRSALLTDQHTRSAAEIMAYGYKRGDFGTVVGTRTAGAVSSGALFVMQPKRKD